MYTVISTGCKLFLRMRSVHTKRSHNQITYLCRWREVKVFFSLTKCYYPENAGWQRSCPQGVVQTWVPVFLVHVQWEGASALGCPEVAVLSSLPASWGRCCPVPPSSRWSIGHSHPALHPQEPQEWLDNQQAINLLASVLADQQETITTVNTCAQ